VSLLLLVVYLFGGHAAAHGFSWCLDAGDHAHLEQNFGDCANTASSCEAEAVCAAEVSDDAASHGQAECRHLPFSSPHRHSCSQTHARTNEAAISAAIPVAFSLQPATVATAALSHRYAVLLPPLQVLAALRHIVLTC
jgi:hypothetical protein